MRVNPLASMMLVCVLAFPVLAGEVNTPGKTPPPPPPACTENCATTAPAPALPVLKTLVLAVLGLLRG